VELHRVDALLPIQPDRSVVVPCDRRRACPAARQETVEKGSPVRNGPVQRALAPKGRNSMRPKTLLFLTTVLLSQASLAVGQGSSSGSSGSTGSSGATSGAPGNSTSAPQNSVSSGTGPTPAPTSGQSFSLSSNSGTPGTGSTDTRIPNGTGPAPAPTPGQSTSMPSGSSGTTGSAQHSRCSTPSTLGIGTTSGGTPRIAEDPNVPRTGSGSGAC